MNNIEEQISDIASNTSDLINQHSKIVRLEIYERMTNLIASGISSSVILVFGIFSFLFLNIGLSYYISQLLNSITKGFLVVGTFYALVLGIYLILKNKIANNKIKNAILIKLSKDIEDFDELIKMQNKTYQDIEVTKQNLKTNFNNLKNTFIPKNPDNDSEEKNNKGPILPRMAITSTINFILQNIIFKRAGFFKHTLVPILANAFVTSKVFNETKGTSLIENLKLRLSKFFL